MTTQNNLTSLVKSNNLYLFSFIIISLFTFESCSIQKRHYRSGYYVEWNGKNHNVESVKEKRTDEKLNVTNKSIIESNYSISVHDSTEYENNELVGSNLEILDTIELFNVSKSKIITDSILAKSNSVKLSVNNPKSRNQKNKESKNSVEFDKEFTGFDVQETRWHKGLFNESHLSATKISNTEPGDFGFFSVFSDTSNDFVTLLLIIIAIVILTGIIASIIEYGLATTLLTLLVLCIIVLIGGLCDTISSEFF